MKKIMGILLLFGLIAAHKSEGQQKKQVADWSYYQSIIDYNLFRPLGWRPPDTSPKYELIATKILSKGSSKALIKETRSNQTYYVGIGDQIQGAKVENIGDNQASLNSGGKPISLLGGGLQFLNSGKGQRGNRGRSGRGEEAKEGSRGRGQGKSDRGKRSRSKNGKGGGKERGKNSSSKGSVQAEAKGWIDWAENASDEERREALDSDKFRNLSPEVQEAIKEGIDD